MRKRFATIAFKQIFRISYLRHKLIWTFLYLLQHAEVLFKRGINVLEDSSNWDWDESQQVTVSGRTKLHLVKYMF